MRPCGVKSGKWIWFYKCILVRHMTRCTFLPNLWRLHLSYISQHHNIQAWFPCKDREWKVMWKLSLNVIFLFLCLYYLWHIYRDSYSVWCNVTKIMNNWQFPIFLCASRIFSDKEMESAVERKLLLGTILWFSFICGQLCVGNMTHNVYVKGS
jgi:hypothetical protein